MLRATIFVVALAASATASLAQITLDRNHVLPAPGTWTLTSYEIDVEDEGNEDAISAIVAASGENMVYDFTALTFNAPMTATLQVEPGAVGPGAEIEPLNMANYTLSSELEFEEEGESFSGKLWAYTLLTDEAMFDLGNIIESDGEVLTQLKSLPAGELTAQFPLAFGDSWTSEVEEVINFGGVIEISTENTYTYTVDGWGVLRTPGFEAGIPALRMRREGEWEQFGTRFTDVCFRFITASQVNAEICENELGDTYDASVTTYTQGPTSAEADLPERQMRLHPAYPNPARSEVHLAYELDRDARVELQLFDILGRQVRDVVATIQPPGKYQKTVDVAGLARGLYVARLKVNGASWTRPVVLVD